MTTTPSVPGDGPIERERIAETARLVDRLLTDEYGDENWRELGSTLRIATAIERHLAARTPAPSAAQALPDIDLLAEAHEEQMSEFEDGFACGAREAAEILRAVLARLDAAPTDPGTRRVEVKAQADAWDEAAEAVAEWAANNPSPSGIPHDPPSNPYRARLRTPGTEETGR